MKHIARLAIAAAFAASSTFASAATIISYGGSDSASNSTYVNPAAGTVANSAVVYRGFNSGIDTLSTPQTAGTVNIGTGGTWAGPAGASSYVSFANTAPGSGNYPTDGTYTYSTTITGVTAGQYLSLTVYADDTTSVYLNGIAAANLVVPSASNSGQAAHCTNGTPNCMTSSTYNILLTAGTDTLYFGVDQLFDNATGLDFAGTIANTPEPGSLALLGTTLIGAAGAFRRRLVRS